MEFFANASIATSTMQLQRHLRIDNLPMWCGEIDRVIESGGEQGSIYCLWGEFRVHREVIKDGVRFTLPGCPNALQWTITTSRDEPESVTIHCTIDKPRHEPEFVESIEAFVEAWREGLESQLSGAVSAARRRPQRECTPWYG